jgi:hypothetical protein
MNENQKTTPVTASISMVFGLLPYVFGLAAHLLRMPLVGLLGFSGAVPAIICGHLAKSRIRKEPNKRRGGGLALCGIFFGYMQIVAVAFLSYQYIKAARLANARSDVQAWCTACRTYRNEYRNFPVEKREIGTGDIGGDLSSYPSLVQALTGRNQELNPRGLVFIDASPVDPWGQPYRFRLDTDFNGRIKVGDSEQRANCAIWSAGPNREDEHGAGDDLMETSQ